MRIFASGAILASVTVGVIALTAHPDDRRRDRLRIGAFALGIRVLLALMVSVWLVASESPWVFSDEGDFLLEARSVMAGEGFIEHGYSNFLGLLFRISGSSAWLPRWINVVIGAALAVVVYELAYILAGRRAAFVSGAAVALWPSLALWSAVVLKDPLTILSIFVVLLGGLWALRGRWLGVGAAILGATVVQQLRPHSFVVVSLALSVGLAALIARRGFRQGAPAASLVLAVGLLGIVGGEGFLGLEFVNTWGNPEGVARIRELGTKGATAFGESSPMDEVLGGLPERFLHAMLGPFPWEVGDPRAKIVVGVELGMWSAALALALIGAWKIGARRLVEQWVLPLSFVGGASVVLVIYESNAGTVMRHRGMIIPVVLVLAASLAPSKLGLRGRIGLAREPQTDQHTPASRFEFALDRSSPRREDSK